MLVVGLAVQGPVTRSDYDARSASICSAINGGQQVVRGSQRSTRWSCSVRSQPAGGVHVIAIVSVREVVPHLGDPCQNIYYYPVTFSASDDGGVYGTFEFAGGKTSGRLPLSHSEADLIVTHAAYVSDATVGSFELPDPERAGDALVCRLSTTYHFYCPANDLVDDFCFTWIRRSDRRR